MSDGEHTGALDGEAPINPYTLQEAVNASAETAQRGWLIFIVIMVCLTVTVAGVTHKDLLLARDIHLPILQVPIALIRFFLFAPIILVLFHIGIIGQLVVLAKKGLELDGALRMVEATDRRTHPLRLELGNFFFVQAIAGPERSRIISGLLNGLTWLTLVLLPVLLLLYVQVTFLPYHAIAITWVHRLTVLADIALLLLSSAFLVRPEPSLGTALVRAVTGNPMASAATLAALIGLGVFSCLFATVPGELLDRVGRDLLPSGRRAVAASPGASRDGRDRLFGVFERNLHVTDTDLAFGRDLVPGQMSLNLRGRDLRYARLDRSTLRQADFTGAGLDGASLVGADLRGASLRCGDVALLLQSEDRVRAGCASAYRADLAKARLAGADLSGIDLGGATLDGADLSGARLNYAILTGASAYGARFAGADLTGGVAAQGVNFATAALQGADLTGAKLQGTDLTGAGLQGATLDLAGLEGAGLRNAGMEGASLVQAGLALADLTGATVTGASLSKAAIWNATAPDAKAAGLADLADIRLARPGRDAIAMLEKGLKRMADPPLEARLREQLRTLLAEDGATPAADGSARSSGWENLVSATRLDAPDPPPSATNSVGLSAAPLPADTSATRGDPPAAAPNPAAGTTSSPASRTARGKAHLTRFLGDLACKERYGDGAVATGLARRAAAPGFEGDAAALLERLRQPQCPASRTVSTKAMRMLADAVEDQAGK